MMIIQCPKCKAKFNIDINNITKNQKKFQCSDCAYVWSYTNLDNQKLPSCLDDAVSSNKEILDNNLLNKVNPSNKTFLGKIFFIIILAIIFFGIVYLFIEFSSFKNTSIKLIGEKEASQMNGNGLYMEMIKPLELVKEGGNSYIIVRGFVYNPKNISLSIPRILIKLLNKHNRVLHEQEREMDITNLKPLEKAEFSFKVFNFSSQVARVEIDFVDPNKI